MISYDKMLLFPIPTYTGIVPNFSSYQHDVLDYITNYRKKHDSVHVSNVNGYQSPSDIHTDSDFYPICQQLWDSVISPACDLLHNQFNNHGFNDTSFSLLNAWFNVNNNGSWNTIHTHPHCFFSGVLWIKAPKDSGDILLHSPHSHTLYGLEDNAWAIPPEEGRVVLFPSFISHNVNINNSSQDRISIAFNITMNN